MRFFHISDLHLGIRVNEFSMIGDQRYILADIVRLVGEHKPDAVLIAGDIYDKTVPSIEAVQLLDKFLVQLHELEVAVYLISGNHDSTERMSFAASLLEKSNIHIAQAYNGGLRPIVARDEFGDVNIWLMPYLRPSIVRNHFPSYDIITYSDAVAAVLSCAEVNVSARNVLVSHQFVTGAICSESEELYVGGSENVDSTLFGAFDYVALGHLHRPQHVTKPTLRYCGTPLKYSLSEASHMKSVTVLDMKRKGDVEITEIPLAPIRDLREIRGTYNELAALKSYAGTNTDDYVYVVLTDEHEEPDAAMKLRSIYPNLMRLRYDNARTQADYAVITTANYEHKEPVDLLDELYKIQNGQPMNQEQREYSLELLSKVWEEKE